MISELRFLKHEVKINLSSSSSEQMRMTKITLLNKLSNSTPTFQAVFTSTENERGCFFTTPKSAKTRSKDWFQLCQLESKLSSTATSFMNKKPSELINSKTPDSCWLQADSENDSDTHQSRWVCRSRCLTKISAILSTTASTFKRLRPELSETWTNNKQRHS